MIAIIAQKINNLSPSQSIFRRERSRPTATWCLNTDGRVRKRSASTCQWNFYIGIDLSREFQTIHLEKLVDIGVSS